MKSPQERLNDQLEQLMGSAELEEHFASSSLPLSGGEEFEIDRLVVVAQQLQSSPQLQVSSDFADLLERRVLRHHLEQRRKRVGAWSFLRCLQLHAVLAATVGLCVLVILFGTGMLAVAAHATSPENPLYGLKEWEQHVQYALASSPAEQAELDLQFARDRLQALSGLTGQADNGLYLQTLSSFQQQFVMATRAVNALPAGPQQVQLASELGELERNARQELYTFLPKLVLSERLATTVELGRLGEAVPVLTSATLILPTHPSGRAIISIVGSGIQSGAQLVVDGRAIQVTGTMSEGQTVFILDWHNDKHPQSLGILNPNGTAVQTNSVIVKKSNNVNGNRSISSLNRDINKKSNIRRNNRNKNGNGSKNG